MSLWRDRFPILGPEDAAELEGTAALHELGEGLPRHQAEETAHRGWLARQLVRTAAHHLSGMRAAHAANNRDDAVKHSTLYAVALKALGHPVVGEPPPEVAALARDPQATPVYQYRSHPADGLLLDALRASKGRPLGKAESPLAGTPVEQYPEGETVWDMSHLLSLPARAAGTRLHVREGASMEGLLFQEHEGRRRPIARYGVLDGDAEPHPWEAERPTTPAEDEAASKAFRLRRLTAKATVASKAGHVADLLQAARDGVAKAEPRTWSSGDFPGDIQIPSAAHPARAAWDKAYQAGVTQRFGRAVPMKVKVGELLTTNPPVANDRVKLYARMLRGGDRVPPLVVRQGPGGLTVLDGNHRVAAARAAGATELPALVVPASRRR